MRIKTQLPDTIFHIFPISSYFIFGGPKESAVLLKSRQTIACTGDQVLAKRNNEFARTLWDKGLRLSARDYAR